MDEKPYNTIIATVAKPITKTSVTIHTTLAVATGTGYCFSGARSIGPVAGAILCLRDSYSQIECQGPEQYSPASIGGECHASRARM